MTSKTLTLTLLAGGLLLATARADAGELSALFDLNLRFGDRGFTLGGRVGGPLGPAGATVNGRWRRGGVEIDGFVHDRDTGYTFELDANVRDGLRATVRPAPQRI